MLDQVISLLGSFTQTTRLLRLTTPLGSDELLAECVRGEESISAGYTFTISALSTQRQHLAACPARPAGAAGAADSKRWAGASVSTAT